MALTTSQIPKTTLDVSRNVEFHTAIIYKSIVREWEEIVEKKNVDRPIMQKMGYEGSRTLAETPEGAKSATTDIKEGYIETIRIKKYSYDFPITWETRKWALKDSNLSKQIGAFMAESAKLSHEYVAMSTINNGFTAGAYATGDGKAYFATDHIFKYGDTYSNLLTAADFSKDSLEVAIKRMASAKKENGVPISLMPRKVVYGIDNIMTVPEVLKTQKDPDNARVFADCPYFHFPCPNPGA